MALKKWSEEGVTYQSLNANSNAFLRKGILNTIRQLGDRTIKLSADGGEWAENYIDASGRLNSVDISLTESLFSADKYVSLIATAGSTDTTNRTTTSTSYVTVHTYSSVNQLISKVISTISCNGTGGGFKITFNYSDSTSYTTTEYAQGATPAEHTFTNTSSDKEVSSIELLGIVFSTGTLTYDDTIQYILSTTESIITHDIPSGTFSATMAAMFGTMKVEDWEAGADVQYKLTNATEDTGWLNTNEVAEFTAFTAEPDTCIVKLIPKTSSPTAGYPAINGFGLEEW